MLLSFLSLLLWVLFFVREIVNLAFHENCDREPSILVVLGPASAMQRASKMQALAFTLRVYTLTDN